MYHLASNEVLFYGNIAFLRSLVAYTNDFLWIFGSVTTLMPVRRVLDLGVRNGTENQIVSNVLYHFVNLFLLSLFVILFLIVCFFFDCRILKML